MLKLLAAPPTNDRSPRYMERALAAIHQAVGSATPITFLYAATTGRVGLFLQYDDNLEELVAGPVAANYPNCNLTTTEIVDGPEPNWETWSAELDLTPELFPILRHAQFEDLLNGTFADPINGILRAIQPTDDVRCRVGIHFVPASHRRRRYAVHAVRLLDREFFRRHHRLAEYYAEHITRRGWLPAWILGILARQSPHASRTILDTSASRLHDREENLQAASGKIGGHLFETHIHVEVYTAPGAAHLATERFAQVAGAFGAFTQSRLATFRMRRVRLGALTRFARRGSLLSHEEIATLFHPPTATVAAERMQTLEFRELEPPAVFRSGTEDGAVRVGRVLFRGDERTIGMDEDSRRRHVYVVGATGAGKSTLLLNLIGQDMAAGRGLTVVDVHGDLAEASAGQEAVSRP